MKVRNLSYHVAKLFGSRTGPNSHIWLEGVRLASAGFAPGTAYTQIWYDDKLVCTTRPSEYVGDPPRKYKTIMGRKVGIKDGDPVIRIEGQRVHDTFGKHGVSVRVAYTPGVIIVEREGTISDVSIPKGVITHGNEAAELAEMGVRL